MPIIVEENALKGRLNEVRKLLSPMSKSVNAQRDKFNTNEFILGAVSQNMSSSGPTKDWRFKTKTDGFYANYTEKWIRLQGASEWNLVYSYLTLYNGPLVSGKEVLALHCDPNEPKNSKFYKYKCGPHMHIHHTDDIVKSAHIALNLSNYEIVVNDILQLNKAFADAISMVASEFLK